MLLSIAPPIELFGRRPDAEKEVVARVAVGQDKYQAHRWTEGVSLGRPDVRLGSQHYRTVKQVTDPPIGASSNAVSGLRPLEAPVWLRRGFHWTKLGHPRPWRASRHPPIPLLRRPPFALSPSSTGLERPWQ